MSDLRLTGATVTTDVSGYISKFGLLPVVMRGQNCRQFNAMFFDSFHDLLTVNHRHIIT